MAFLITNKFLSISNPIVTLGSCFADNIASILHKNKFQILSNPFGVIYHPIPLLKILNDSVRNISSTSDEYLNHDGLWRWWGGHGSLASKELFELESKISDLKYKVNRFLYAENSFLILTFGTSYLYETIHGSFPVANCHKLPAENFQRRFTPYNEFLGDWINILEFIISKVPTLQIIVTVSPVRHIKDGLHQNNLSKANLLLFVNHLANHFKNNISYFPAYEIMIDELRDYQYYKDDKIHPNEKALHYIYRKFSEAYLSEDTQTWVNQLNSLQNELNHRPLHTQSDSFRKFVPKLEVKLNSIIKTQPDKDWTLELNRMEELKNLL